jgi:hypothetical protein
LLNILYLDIRKGFKGGMIAIGLRERGLGKNLEADREKTAADQAAKRIADRAEKDHKNALELIRLQAEVNEKARAALQTTKEDPDEEDEEAEPTTPATKKANAKKKKKKVTVMKSDATSTSIALSVLLISFCVYLI